MLWELSGRGGAGVRFHVLDSAHGSDHSVIRKPTSNEDLKRKYRWQCRRGASEVEVVLYAYLDDASTSRLSIEPGSATVDCQDADMFEWFALQ